MLAGKRWVKGDFLSSVLCLLSSDAYADGVPQTGVLLKDGSPWRAFVVVSRRFYQRKEEDIESKS